VISVQVAEFISLVGDCPRLLERFDDIVRARHVTSRHVTSRHVTSRHVAHLGGLAQPRTSSHVTSR